MHRLVFVGQETSLFIFQSRSYNLSHIYDKNEIEYFSLHEDGRHGDVIEITEVEVHGLGQYTFDDISCLGTALSPRYQARTRMMDESDLT